MPGLGVSPNFTGTPPQHRASEPYAVMACFFSIHADVMATAESRVW